ncbi:tetratricopeptide repeat-containing diguanylate cyclase [Saccharospirillum impatiens]|uniref:tetratricopeptide repeat-containing diguanylate cyclase n=1 Tax=Saccharospirillum impatiens TaxID=169438 RepID=UPI0003F73AC4|nr:tetratricopeptide repeat-containing diguanylate cyclase [Saccharospirillum impatiens]
MNQTYPLRLLDNAWQQTLKGQGQCLLFADADGRRFSSLVDAFMADLPAECIRYQLTADSQLNGYYPLVDIIQDGYGRLGITDCCSWLREQGVYGPNLTTWQQILDDHFIQRQPLQLKDHVIQKAIAFQDDIICLLIALAQTRPIVVALSHFHFASISLQRLVRTVQQQLSGRVLLLTSTDTDLMASHELDWQSTQHGADDDIDPPHWLIDLSPDLIDDASPWPEPESLSAQSIPKLIQDALRNHALQCHTETHLLCDRIGLMLDERQILLLSEHRSTLRLIEAEALYYKDQHNGAITLLTELLEEARHDHLYDQMFDAYVRLGWCALTKHRLSTARQMATHAQTALEQITIKDAPWLLREREWLLLQVMISSMFHERPPANMLHRLEALLPMLDQDDYGYALRTAQIAWESSMTDRERYFLRRAILTGLSQARAERNDIATVKLTEAMALLQTKAHRLQRAHRLLELALDRCQRMASPRHEAPIYNGLGIIQMRLGRISEARDTFLYTLHKLQTVAHYNEIAVTLHNLSWAYLISGNVQESLRLLSTAIRLCRIRGFVTIPFYTLDDLLLQQALYRFYLGHSVLAQHTLQDFSKQPEQQSVRGKILLTCLKLHFARAEADYKRITTLVSELRTSLETHQDLPDTLLNLAWYAAGSDSLPSHLTPAYRIQWMHTQAPETEPMPASNVDLMSVLRAADLESELEHIQQRVRDTRLLSHLSAQTNAATDTLALVETLCQQLKAHLDCDYVAIELTQQPFMNATLITRGLPDLVVERLHQALSLQRLTRGRLLVRMRNLDIEGLDSGYVCIFRIALPHHDFGDMILMTRNPSGFEESVLRTASMLAGQLAAAIQRLIHEKELHHLSSTDMLTGLMNRQALYPRLEEELARGRRNADYRFSLAFLDLDNFKYLNDNYGHILGDQVLRGFAQLLKEHTRTEDLAARLGGDEFVILFPNERGQAVQQLAQRILEDFATPARCQAFLRRFTGQEFTWPEGQQLGCSVGIIEVTGEQAPRLVDQLLNLADHAMYEAKSRGKNQAVISDLPSTPNRH